MTFKMEAMESKRNEIRTAIKSLESMAPMLLEVESSTLEFIKLEAAKVGQ